MLNAADSGSQTVRTGSCCGQQNICLLRLSHEPCHSSFCLQIEATWEQLFLDPSTTYEVYDVLAQKSVGTASGKWSASVRLCVGHRLWCILKPQLTLVASGGLPRCQLCAPVAYQSRRVAVRASALGSRVHACSNDNFMYSTHFQATWHTATQTKDLN